MRARSGQAMIEFALGLFVLALVLSALLSIGKIIPESTRLQSVVRREAGRNAESGGGTPNGALPAAIRGNLPDPMGRLAAVELTTSAQIETVDLDAFAAEYLFDTNEGNEYRIRETTSLPVMGVPQFPPSDLLDTPSPGGNLL